MKPNTVDQSLWFMPQILTALSYTPAYATLTPAQRLRYNQLHALYLNEQIIFFERSLAPNVLGYFLGQGLPAQIRGRVEEFRSDEERHSEMFRRLNRMCAPELYALGDFHFIRMAALPARLLGFVSRRPRAFPMLLWLMHLQEERALFFGREFLKCEHAIEPHFLAAQRAHLADEVSHVHCDKLLLDLVWPEASRWVRLVNIRLLAWMMKEYFGAPKRTQLNVVSALAREFPELQKRLPEIRRDLLNLRNNKNYMRTIYSRETVPDVFARFDRSPEFRPLTRAIPGYVPNYSA